VKEAPHEGMASATKKEQEAMREVARKEREVARKEQEAAKEAAWKARESAWEAEMKEKEGILETMAKELDDLKSKRGSEATSQVGTPGKIAGAKGQVIHEGREVCEANLGDTASVKEVVGAELAPLVQLVSHLTARVEQLSRGAGSVGTAIDEGTGQAAVGQNSSGGSQPSRVPEGWPGQERTGGRKGWPGQERTGGRRGNGRRSESTDGSLRRKTVRARWRRRRGAACAKRK